MTMSTIKDAIQLTRKDTIDFFGGDELATDVFLKKYAITRTDGTLEEYLPPQMWERMARAASSVEKDQDVWYRKFYSVLEGWKAVPQGSIMFALGNPYQRSSCSNCFVAGTEVLTKNGPKAIESVTTDDYVLTKSGVYHRVEQLHISEIEDRGLFSFKAYRSPWTSCTGNHSFWSITQEQIKWGEGPSWNPVSHLRPGDYIAIPRQSDFSKNRETIDLHMAAKQGLNSYQFDSVSYDIVEQAGKFGLVANFSGRRNEKEYKSSKSLNKVSKGFYLVEESAYMLGVWFGDGCVFGRTKEDPAPMGISFTFGAHEKENSYKIKDIAERCFGLGGKILENKNDNTIQVIFHSRALGLSFEHLFGRGYDGKRLPTILYKMPNEIVFAFLRGLIDSDGTITKDGDIRIVLNNKPLIKQVYHLLRSRSYLVGYAESGSSARIDLPRNDDIIDSLSKKYADDRLLVAANKESRSLNSLTIDEAVFVRIMDKKKLQHEQGEKVYNIGVDSDHSYTVHGMVAKNCFVVPIHEDSLEGIFNAAKEMAQTYAYRGGVGIDISPLRPDGAVVSNAARTSTGAWSFMDLYSYITRHIGQHGRRGALMLTISDSHPDLLKFITSKTDLTKVTGANISVKISNAFMEAIEKDLTWKMEFSTSHQKVAQEMSAREIWHTLVECATSTAEPGILFWDHIIDESPSDCYADDGFRTICTNPSFRWDTRIVTDRGVMLIKDIAEKTPVCRVRNILGEWHDAFAFKSGENKRLYKISFSGGREVFCTAEHQWPVLNTSGNLINLQTGKIKKKKTETLSRGDKIYLPVFDKPIDNNNCIFTEEDGFVLGWYLGDGYKTYHKRHKSDQFGFVFGPEDQEYKISETVLSYTNRHSNSICNLTPDHGTSTQAYCTRDKKVVGKLKAIGCDDKENGIPASVWGGNDRFIKGFLDGLFSADGYVYVKPNLANCQVKLVTKHDKLADDLVSLLMFYGIRATVTRSDKPSTFPKVKYNNSERLYHDVCISGYNAFLFAKTFSLTNLSKQKRLDEIIQSDTSSYKKERVYQVVTSVESTEIFEDVYDISVDDETHTFQMEQGISGNCSEIPLPAYDACTLLSMNMTRYTRNDFSRDAYFDFEAFAEDVEVALRFLDNVKEIDLDLMPLEQQREVAAKGRRVGMGTNGLGDTLANLGIKYDSDRAVEWVDEFYEFFAKTVYKASAELAKEKGAFPVFDAEKEKDNPFLKRIGFAGVPRRNIAALTCAPTGSLSCLCQTSSGVEPVFRNFYRRRRKITHNEATDIPQDHLHKDGIGDIWQEYDVAHRNVERFLDRRHISLKNKKAEDIKLPSYFVESDTIDWTMRVKIQAAMQKWIDHAISSTCNLPKGTTVETVKKVYEEAFKSGCKGFTVYVDGCRDGVLITKEDAKSTSISKTDAPKRPKELDADVYHITVKGQQYFIMVGLLDGEPYECFAGKNGFIDNKKKHCKIKKVKRGCYQAIFDDGEVIENIADYIEDDEAAITRLISLSLRHGADIKHCVDSLERVPGDMHNFARSLSRAIKKYIPDGTEVTGRTCDTCNGDNLIREEGCIRCADCGWAGCG